MEVMPIRTPLRRWTSCRTRPRSSTSVITDINMEGLDGFDVSTRSRPCSRACPWVLMTGQASVDYAIRAMRMGAANLFMKPIAIREMIQSVFHLVDLHRDFPAGR